MPIRQKPFFCLLPFLLLATLILVGLSGCGGSGGSDDSDLSISFPSVMEGDSGNVEMVFTVTLDEAAEAKVTLDYSTVDGTATEADSDYTTVNGSLTIPKGSSTAMVSVFANGDDDFELDESFSLVVSNIQGTTLGKSSYSGQGTIQNDDDAEPEGYFNGTGTFNSTTYNDLTGMMYEERLLLFSPSANVLYDIDFTAIDVFDFTGTVAVYTDGTLEQAGSVTISGTTNEAEIQGTFADGIGLADGSFTLTFDLANNKGATLARIKGLASDQWFGDFYGVDQDTGRFSSDNLGMYAGLDDTTERCGFVNNSTGLIIPDSELNIYQLSHNVVGQIQNTCTYESTGHTGFISVISNIDVDDEMAFAFSNGQVALFGIMNH